MIQGKVTTSNGTVGQSDVLLAASFPGEDYLLKIVNTNNEGDFFLNVNKDYSAQDVYIQPLSNAGDGLDISLTPEQELDFSKLTFHSFSPDRNMESSIKERSIHNQIENAYYSSKPDTILLGNGNKRFYGSDVTEYVLDEYTRFSTVRETFVEVVEHVWLQANKDGQMEFHVRPEAPYVESRSIAFGNSGWGFGFESRAIVKFTVKQDQYHTYF
ncbi:hypothetical protein NYZ99_08040 [Maribacter litopenaei]|uniref:Carboxypeptidase regulatory-like domain-containing protein n=1 Tax=Maribacter litopenaei TaxID=2976127 RepID=A0ABY5YBF2_9FLAO|nr:hypothetical protein [Maribacter litopenaei]UWX56193.1 hypothetical protein NYZ99_08040 [Maribacter litopenaei]